MLLARADFRAQVFARDGGLCVVCGAEGADAHHILERRLFHDGGYYLDNGVCLCSPCHLKAEQTLIDPSLLRERAGIKTQIRPAHFAAAETTDKWGNPIHPNGRRSRGELFYEEQVQKMLRAGAVLDLYDVRVKYPRSWHLPSSPGATNDDKVLPDTSHLDGREIVASLKLDGEATSLYREHFHARSLESSTHPSQSWLRSFHAAIAHEIPEGWRICGENLFARHSIAYDGLPSYFFVYSIWDERNQALPVDQTIEWCDLLGLQMVPTFYRGPFDEDAVRALMPDTTPWSARNEGFVVRLADGFHYRDFGRSLAKWVIPNFVPGGTGHWRTAAVVPNGITAGSDDQSLNQ
ncbi:RNA ligase family protein [Miltoncostaea oceani]|uniref:RNA ligase family protein n=1 Tax=Miltoncostaea oceani TaxID=2843216 RepID=UPI001FE255EB|nr:RNA ligase family protein [Miltoncostaea oceani]